MCCTPHFPPGPFLIETGRLLLRPPTEADAPAMAAIFGDMRVMEWLLRETPETPVHILERARRHERFFRELGHCIYLVFRKADGALVGDCGVVPAEGRGPETEIAWRFVPDHWGHGYATEAAKAVLTDTFERTDLGHVIAITREDNTRSRRIMDKLGMSFRGVETFYNFPQRVCVITREEWAERTT